MTTDDITHLDAAAYRAQHDAELAAWNWSTARLLGLIPPSAEERHQIAVRMALGHGSDDPVCRVLYELSLTDIPALVAFLSGHTDTQRTRLAWRFAAYLRREHDITRQPTSIAEMWQELCAADAASSVA